MDLMIVTAILSLCLCATAAPQARLPWETLSAASPVQQSADNTLRFHPLAAIDRVWEAFKAEHSMRLVCLHLSV